MTPLVVAAAIGVVRDRRWRTAAACLAVAAVAGVASGATQTERCPHATYVQWFGVTVPIAGTACHNVQPTCPWWLRR